MVERQIIKERLNEKERMVKASKHVVRMFIGTSSLIFTTLLIVWMRYNVPSLSIPITYDIASFVILISSGMIGASQIQIKQDAIKNAFNLTAVGLVLGLIFSVLQVIGWKELVSANDTFRNILLPFSLIHFVHVVVGIVLLVSVFRGIREYRVHSKSRQYAHNVFLFWHFLGGIWLLFMLLGKT